MAKDKNSPKKTAAIFNAMTKAMVTVKPKPKKDIQTKEKKKYVLINILKHGEIIFRRGKYIKPPRKKTGLFLPKELLN